MTGATSDCRLRWGPIGVEPETSAASGCCGLDGKRKERPQRRHDEGEAGGKGHKSGPEIAVCSEATVE